MSDVTAFDVLRISLFSIFLGLHLTAMIASFGMWFAYFERGNLRSQRLHVWRHYVMAFVLSLGGIVSLSQTKSESCYYLYGLKFFPGEKLDSKWGKRIIEMEEQSIQCGGRKQSIW